MLLALAHSPVNAQLSLWRETKAVREASLVGSLYVSQHYHFYC